MINIFIAYRARTNELERHANPNKKQGEILLEYS